MTSDRQRAANRRNAQRSSGPRTAAGKSVSRGNALQHGLSARLGDNPSHSRHVERMARVITGADASPDELYHARIVADATLVITQIRNARTTTLNPANLRREVLSLSVPARVVWQRECRPDVIHFRALANMAGASEDVRALAEQMMRLVSPPEKIPPPPSGPDAEIEILGRFIERVAKLDRYEARQLSRRRKALRALDALRKSKAGKVASDRS